MTLPSRRAQLIALTVELVAVATLAGFGPEFPRDVSSGSAWRFLGQHALEAAHSGLGVLVLLQALVLLIAHRGWGSLVIAAGVATATAAGTTYVSAGQTDASLTAMTLGWLVALVAAVVGLIRGRPRRGQ